MQLLPRYLVSNRTDIIADLAGFVTEYRPVYKRQLQVYKGISNVLEFRLLNADQKPINTTNYTPKFRAFDSENNLVIEKDAVVLDDGSSSTKGLFTVTITENDILNIKDQFLKYNIYLVDTDLNDILTYADTHFGVDAFLKISSEANPGPKNSKIITTFLHDGESWFSSAINADPGLNDNEALHTAVFYTSSYAGDIIVQATLENQITGTTNWANVETISFDGTETDPTPVNVYGVFSFIRFVASADPTDTITKILVRN